MSLLLFEGKAPGLVGQTEGRTINWCGFFSYTLSFRFVSHGKTTAVPVRVEQPNEIERTFELFRFLRVSLGSAAVMILLNDECFMLIDAS